MFKHILYATDFSEPSKRAARAARAMADAYRAEVTMVHVIDRDDSDEVRRNAHSLLDEEGRAYFEGVDELRLIVADHDRADVLICREAETRGVDLIVAGREGAHSFSEQLLGSTTERVARHAHCSLLVAHSGDQDSFVFAKQVVACSDLSPESERAVEEAGELTSRFGGALTLAHIYTVDVPPFTYTGPSEARKDAGMEGHARQWLDKLREDRLGEQAAAIEVQEHASPVAGICDIIEARDADLVAVGTHGRTGLKRLLIGSVAERVIRHAPCSVLVARR